MLFNQMHHVAIIVSDYEKAKEFYVEKLGFPILRENFREDRGDWKLDLRFGDSELEIFAAPNAPARLSAPEAQGLRHLAFRVDDIQVAVLQLKALEVSAPGAARVNYYDTGQGAAASAHRPITKNGVPSGHALQNGG